MRAISDNQHEEQPPRYIVWRCEKIRETDKPLGQRVRDGCGHLQIKRTRSTAPGLMGNCKRCERKARLNPNTRHLYTYESREAAETHVRAMNEHGVTLTPSDILETSEDAHNSHDLDELRLLAEIPMDEFYSSLEEE